MPFVTIARSVASLSGTNIVLFASPGDELLEYGSNSGTNVRVLDDDGDVIVPTFIPDIFLTSPSLLSNGDIVGISNSAVVRYDQTGQIIDQTVGFAPGPGRTTELANGNILVTYDDANGDLRGQLLSPSLDLIGANFSIATGAGYVSDVSALAGGGFTVLISTANGVPQSIQSFDASGTPQGASVARLGYSLGDVQALSDGGYVFFGSKFFSIPGLGFYNPFIQFFNADGTARTTAISTGQLLIGQEHSLSVAALDGDLVVVGSGSTGQLYHSSGRALGDVFQAPFDSLTAAEGIDADTFASRGRLTQNGPTELLYWSVDRANILLGNATAETFNGAGATDRLMAGFGGDDVFNVDSAGDIVHEWAGEGNDTVVSTISYQLRAGAEVELLRTSDDAGTAALNLTGNALAQTIRGNAGDNQLTGGGGGDTLVGLGGADWYFVGNAADVVIESDTGPGIDRVFASVSYALTAGARVEVLSTDWHAGTAAINLIGNELANTIYGNAGDNTLNGGGGADVLVGMGGTDYYFVDDAGDVVIESDSGPGMDRVFASVSYALAAGAKIEVLSTDWHAGIAAINLTGNELANTIYGNAGDNILNGGGAADLLFGMGGTDWYFVDNVGDVVFDSDNGPGTDRVFANVSFTLTAGAKIELLSTDYHAGTAAIGLFGNEQINTIYGNAGDNMLDGKGGSDGLLGMGGADTFAFTTQPHATNVDTVFDFVHAVDKIALDDAVFGGIGTPGTFNPNAFVLGTTAGDTDDRILYDGATGQLFYDADGSGAMAAQLFAILQGAPTLTASDFQVI